MLYSGDEFYGDDVTSPIERPRVSAQAWVYSYSYWLHESDGTVWYRHINDTGAWTYFCTLAGWPSRTPAKKGIKPSNIPL